MLVTKLAIQIQQIVLSFFAYELYLLNNPLFSSQSGHFPLMLAAHPGVIEALRKAAATEQVRYRMLCYREGSVCSGKLLDTQLLHF